MVNSIYMKKINRTLLSLSVLALAATSLTFLGGGVSALNAQEAAIEVSSEQGLIDIARRVEGGETFEGKTILLKNNISLQAGWTPIGSSEHPFMGTFDGDGNSISGLRIVASTPYQGFFGMTSGAEIKDLQISGFSSQFASSGQVYAGAIVGYARNSKITGCEVDEGNFEANISGKVTYGSLAGKLEGGEVNSSANFQNFSGTYELANTYTLKIGGIAGESEATRFTKVANFGDVTLTYGKEQIDPLASSNIYIGGLVGEVSGQTLQIKDCVFGGEAAARNKNMIDNYLVGSVAGNVSAAPKGGNISSVAFKSDVKAFGDRGSYGFVNNVTEDNVMRVSENVLYAQSFYLEDSYTFTLDDVRYTFAWNLDTPVWDFENAFVMVKKSGSQNVDLPRLQLFQNFNISAAELLDPQGLLEVISSPSGTLKYGEIGEISFKFKDSGNFKYYRILDIRRAGVSINFSQFVENEEGDLVSPNGDIVLSQPEGSQVFTLKVSASNASQGAYSFTLKANDFPVYVLAGENGSVGYRNSNLTSSISKDMSAGSNNSIEVQAVGDRKYAFIGWELFYQKSENVVSEGDIEFDGKVWEKFSGWSSNENPLAITFTKGAFTDSFLLRAKFAEDPCTISFTFDSNMIEKVDVNGSVIAQSGGQVQVDKNENITIRLYAKASSEIDSEDFENKLKSLFSRDTVTVRSSIYSDPLNSELKVYEYSFSSSAFNFGSTSTFNLSVKSQVATESEGTNSTTWIIVGVVCGVAVLVATGLIIWFVRRRRFGGGSSDDYKKMYY